MGSGFRISFPLTLCASRQGERGSPVWPRIIAGKPFNVRYRSPRPLHVGRDGMDTAPLRLRITHISEGWLDDPLVNELAQC